MNAAESETMVEAAEKAGVPNMVWYNYRRVPAVTLAKELIDEGPTGPDLPLSRQIPSGLDDFKRLPQGGEGLWRWMSRLRAAASRAICWRIASIRPSG